MVRRNRRSEFAVEETVALGGRLAQKHPETVVYSGGLFIQMRKMAAINWVIENKLIPEKWIKPLTLYYKFLDEERKAYFMSEGSDVLTKLSAMVGVTSPVRATDPAET
jgi:hypothetical protein